MFDILECELDVYTLNLSYSYNEFIYDVVCDFDWLDKEYNGSMLDFTLKPIKGTYFSGEVGNDEEGEIEITPAYSEWLLEMVREYRKKHIYFMCEEEENELRKLDLNVEDDNPQNWHYYGI